MIDLSAADALINAWNDKYHYNFWRPITAIRAVDDLDPDTVQDAGWTPYFTPTRVPLPGEVNTPMLITPPYPDHVSGATTYASASMHAFESFFGTDTMDFFATSGRFPGDQRVFHRFSDLTSEILEARIWAGIHYRNPTRRRRRLALTWSATSTRTGSQLHTEGQVGAAFGPLQPSN
jgi:hypothetical protein